MSRLLPVNSSMSIPATTLIAVDLGSARPRAARVQEAGEDSEITRLEEGHVEGEEGVKPCFRGTEDKQALQRTRLPRHPSVARARGPVRLVRRMSS